MKNDNYETLRGFNEEIKMNTKALRSKILDLAIHGKLLSEKEAAECRKGESACLSADSATELLEKIRKEKEDKIAKGELKADKKSSYIFTSAKRHYEKFADGMVKCVDDEIPFEVPDGWAWCRLGEIFSHNTGKALNSGKQIGELKDYITTSNVYWDKFELDNLKQMYFTKEELEKCTIKKGDLLVCEGGDVGRSAIWDKDYPICIQNHLHRLRPFFDIDVKLYFYVLMYYKMKKMLVGQGIGLMGFSSNRLHNLFVPLPPLSEQKAIVKKIEEIFSQIDILENNKTDLQTTIKHAKTKILDLAIHGKLVPQDPNDEPASKLLDRIHSKCEFAKGKQGKSAEKILHNGRYEKLEDVPFDVPDGWAWCKLPELCCIPITDGTHQTPTYSDKENGIPFLSSKDVTSGKINWTKIKYITKDLHIELSKRIRPKKNDILLAKNGTTGVAALVETDDIFDIYVTLAVIRPNLEIINPKYLHEIINSTFCKKQFNAHLTGIGVPNLHLVDINKTIIPLPPLAEQKRIVEKIESLFSSLDKITGNLS